MIQTTISEVINSIIQVILFSLIPFIWWLITARRKESFFSWIGLKKPSKSFKSLLPYILVIFIVCEALGLLLYNGLLRTDWNTSQFAGAGAAGIPCALIYSYIQTAFSEEILFRGFIQKRLQHVMDFKIAAVIQGILFGAIHVVLSLNYITFAQGVVLLLYPMITAILMAFINEKKADGSILPSWLIHGTLNTITQFINL